MLAGETEPGATAAIIVPRGVSTVAGLSREDPKALGFAQGWVSLGGQRHEALGEGC